MAIPRIVIEVCQGNIRLTPTPRSLPCDNRIMSERNALQTIAHQSRRYLGPILTGAVAASVAIPWFALNDEEGEIDASARAASGAKYLNLSAGQTHYEVAGAEDAPPVVLVHGISVPSFVWDHNFEVLARSGHRVIRYDLFGRGLSDRPAGRYDLDLHVGQLAELIAALVPGRAVDLAGVSMGGIVVTEFARRFGDRVGKVALIDPAGAETSLPLVAKAAVAPVFGEYVMRVAGTRHLLPSRRNLLHPERHPDFDAKYLATIRFDGSRRAVLRSLRHMPIANFEAGYASLGKSGRRVLLVWGRGDAVTPFSESDRMRELVRPAEFVVVEDAGHLSNFEQPEIVNAALVAFLAR